MTTDSEHASPGASADPGPLDPARPRTRTGLSKLRGAPAEVTAPVAEVPDPTAPTAPTATSAAPETISLLKTSSEPSAHPKPVRATGRRLLVGVIALAVAAAVMVGFVIAGWNDSDSHVVGGSATSASSKADVNERFAALQASRQFAVSFFTYDYRKVDAYFRRIEAASTGSFRSDFVSKEATLKTVLTKLKTVATGQVADTGAGIFALADDKAVAFVAANLNASNATTKDGQRRYRVKLTLQKVKGNWLVSDFQEVV